MLQACHQTPFYASTDHPKWMDNSHTTATKSDSKLKVVSFNIEYSQRIDQAIEELRSDRYLSDPDILLLQEMDEQGTQAIAEAFNYNYIYYPVIYNEKKGNNYGNAILSKWPIEDERKIILPHEKPFNKARRIATSATVTYGDLRILVYSAHIETFIMRRSKRMEQIRAILEDVNHQPDADLFIIGGDFNTILKEDERQVVRLFEHQNLEWASRKTGHTVRVILDLYKPTLDHIFTRGFEVVNSGKATSTAASDHRPIWAELALTTHE